MTATFMPKPLFGDNGSGMHVHQSIWQGWRPALCRRRRCRLERSHALLHRRAAQARAGAARDLRADRQLLPAARCRASRRRSISAIAAQPLGGLPDPDVLAESEDQARRVSLPGSLCNPYLAFAAMLMAGLDGIQNRIDPGEPIDKNLYDLPPAERAKIPRLRARWARPSMRWRRTGKFLLKGDVFTADVIETYLDYKRSHESRRDTHASSSVRVCALLRRIAALFREGLAAKGGRQGYTVRSRRSPRQWPPACAPACCRMQQHPP